MARSSDVICSSSQQVAGPGLRAEPERPFCSATPPVVVGHSPFEQNRSESTKRKGGAQSGSGAAEAPPGSLTRLVLGVKKEGCWVWGQQSFVSMGVRGGQRTLPLGTKWEEWRKSVCLCKVVSIH